MAAAIAPEEIWSGPLRTASQRLFDPSDNIFSPSSGFQREEDDEEALKWAAIEKLPTFKRLRTGILKNIVEADGHVIHEEVDVSRLGREKKDHLLDKILRVVDEDNERFLLKFRDRFDKVGIELPKIEVRFENLNIEADAYVGSRALPTLFNFSLNIVEAILARIHLLPERKRTLTVLKNISGIVKPSRMTLLLGPPASGRTTLLLALTGKLDPKLRVSGQVTYNGHNISEFVPQRTSAYISQLDTHFGEMTVRETLDFSGRCQGVGTRYDMLMDMLRREKEADINPDPDLDIVMKASSIEGQETSIVTDYVMKLLGLDICADTLVGNEMLRGISGGQKKRVTTGEMLVGPNKALFMDEISTGLDSSTTYQIIKCMSQYVRLLDGTMVIALLQPAPETFDLFDDVILLSEGEIVYQGPRELVLDFFETMGFKCPNRKNVADFLQEVTSRKDQEQYWADRSQPYRYIPVKEFAKAFGSFHLGQGIQEERSVPLEKSRNHPASLSTQKYGLDKWELFKACFWREQLLMKRNSFLYIFKTVQISILSLITMTVFFRTKLHAGNIADGNLYMSALFFGLIIVMFNGFAELSMTISRLPVFYKQRDQMFHPAWAVSVPTIITRLPFSFLESGIWVCLTYYVIGFAPEPGRFFRQFLLLFWVSQMAYGLFRFIGAVARSMVVADIFGSFALMAIFVLGGFVVSKDNIPKGWIWGYWISPMMYGQNAIAVNEFLAPRWDMSYNDTTTSASTVGKAVLKELGISTHGYWYWIGVGALVGFTVVFNVLYSLALAYLNPLSRPQAIIPMEEDIVDKRLIQTRQVSQWLQSRTNRRSTDAESLTEGLEVQERNSSDSSIVGSDRFDMANEVNVKASERGMALPFQPLSITFHNINYYVDMPAEMRQQRITEDKLQLLHNISGAFRPGILTALVGESGAGKTTLMDVLAGRKTVGYTEGDISISGYPKKQEAFARIAGYCEQTDIHSPNVTVKESLIYSAWLRLPKEVDEHTRMVFVDEVMTLVELTTIQNAIVGLPGVSGLSVEQRKRLTIAVELVANPSIIFMDEPTSGLDARAAAIVMRTIRNTVDTGRTVVCTIHQPSIDIFEAFDELLLLKRGGRVIYGGTLGHHSHKLVEYFEAINGVPKIKEGYNPAMWMLDISSVGAETRLGVDFAQIYNDSSLFKQNEALIKDLSTPAPNSKELYFPSKYSKSFVVQFMACLWKKHWSYWRDPNYNAVRLFFTTIIALLLGTVFWGLGSKISKQHDIANIMGSMYCAVLFLGFSNAKTVQPVVDIERTVFYREKASGMYSPLADALAQVVVEIPYVLVQTFVYGLIVFSMMNFQWTAVKLFWFLFFVFCAFLYLSCYGMMVVAMTPNLSFAAIISVAVFSMWNLFSGFMISVTRIPIWWRWYYWADPVSWTLYGLITSQLGDLDGATIEVPGSGIQSVPEYLRESLSFRHEFLGAVAGVNVGLIVLFASVFAFSITFLNFQKR